MAYIHYQYFPKIGYIFNVRSTKITSGKKYSIFLARTGTKIPLRIQQNTSLQVKKFNFFSGEGAWGGVPRSPHATPCCPKQACGWSLRPPRILTRFTPMIIIFIYSLISRLSNATSETISNSISILSQRIIDSWDRLPEAAVNATSNNAFKNRLDHCKQRQPASIAKWRYKGCSN